MVQQRRLALAIRSRRGFRPCGSAHPELTRATSCPACGCNRRGHTRSSCLSIAFSFTRRRISSSDPALTSCSAARDLGTLARPRRRFAARSVYRVGSTTWNTANSLRASPGTLAIALVRCRRRLDLLGSTRHARWPPRAAKHPPDADHQRWSSNCPSSVPTICALSPNSTSLPRHDPCGWGERRCRAATAGALLHRGRRHRSARPEEGLDAIDRLP